MAEIDYDAARLYQERKKAYDDLKASLKERGSAHDEGRTFDERMNDSNVDDATRAHEYLIEQERYIEKLTKVIEKYQTFFEMLKDLTPRQHSIHDRIY